MTRAWLAPVIAYLLGSIPIGYIMARLARGVDIRHEGSGNIGATNVARVMGTWPGLLVLLLDALKGALAAGVVPAWLDGPLGVLTPFQVRLVCGVAAVVGHIAPCFLRLQGGKGVATALGVLLTLLPAVAGVCAAVWVLVFLWRRYVSLASIAAAISLPFAALLMVARADAVLFCACLAWLAVWRHQGNIRRLYLGQEPKFGE